MDLTGVEVVGPAIPESVSIAAERPSLDVNAVLRSPAFWPGVILLLGIVACFWSLLSGLPKKYLSDDGYYSHGFLIPVIVGYIVYRWWPRLRSIPVRPGWIALVPLIAVLYVVRAGYLAEVMNVLSLGLLVTILLGAWFIAGWRWMTALTLPTAYLAFGLPDLINFIEGYTVFLQQWSTSFAFKMLQLLGSDPYREDVQTIIMPHGFTLHVAVQCSGLKLFTAVTAFTAFFMLIGGLRWWSNLVMVALILPLCLFINGLRVALIGIVGDRYGNAAGMTFHDYSGYITLLICFFILFKIARWLGWKD